MKTNRAKTIFLQSTVYFLIFLFIYAAFSKLMDFEAFQVQLAQSPLLSAYAGIISYAVIILELIIAGLLYLSKTRLIGLYASFGLMISFTVYIYLILNFSDFVPCSCGGILEKMGWTEHLIFNIVWVIFALVSILIMESQKETEKKKYILLTAFTALLSTGIVIILFRSSEHIIKEENNFTRRFLPHPIYYPETLDLKVNSFYFAGNNGDTLFLGNSKAPLLFGEVLPVFKSLSIDTLKIPDYTLPYKYLQLNIRYPFVSLSDGTVPIIMEGKFPDKKLEIAMHGQTFFSQIKMVKENTFVIKTTLEQGKTNTLGLLSTKPFGLTIKNNVLEKQIDGIFDTDGSLVYDSESGQLAYTYFYRNKFIVMNPSLDVLYTGKTIDTISKAQIHLTKLKDGKIKMDKPPLQVNGSQALCNGILFNVSHLRGLHEPKKMWQQAKIADAYNIVQKKYLYSFYVNHNGKDQMREMLVTPKYFYILKGTSLIKYKRMR
ncbi:hypothetical protein KB553_09500 [Chryseobacterium rhizoplanae]|uniref:DoxX family protein n=1 Tax=Chryseobacterium rhizoplanae TaxID=1609531 RepID=UPI001CE30CF2|nr:MauE/DoxX family redox-associated membrane protein [Chryseobacterium rhizoplanae]UCA61748.1 hypothetical protein KB553_09500 [Chryseobacterium rhizoplanae]